MTEQARNRSHGERTSKDFTARTEGWEARTWLDARASDDQRQRDRRERDRDRPLPVPTRR